ncbi:polyribonucleotide nucleotidyltransferase [Candidatus Shapirobacteria bacterium CG07_land_8_20_14_0_80_39_18]|uniref:Polyribonucleotide nucleotidyltransferase n=1 Tax=Candidatus Shapirobacteria bacterium CG07_land_8_20_14_0_80_39_18 TaxID=1974882 RepID=A0A2M6YRT5_9BACT|nr:MAG: polyribonucleotide nucleotidyltransferase [Candidatus Shapirobacteria bacterium CG07_land_8_20_14_0_80_39_18]
MKIVSKETEIGGRKLKLEVGRFAPLSTASVLAQYGETMVLATVVRAKPKEDLGYFPLSVEYVERLYAGGRIKGSRWVKREGRPSDVAVLIDRLVDRSIRPLFPKNYFDEVQVTITVLSVDLENDPGVLSAVATSAALTVSDIPWNGPIGVVRVGLKEGVLFVNPTETEKGFSDLDLVVSSGPKKVIMIEGQSNEIPESQILEAISFAKKEAETVISLIEDLRHEVGSPKLTLVEKELKPEIKQSAQKFVEECLETIFTDKVGREISGSGSEEILPTFLEDFPAEQKKEAREAFEYYWKKLFKEKVLAGKRVDGRSLDAIRPIEIEVGVLPRTHGSAMFKRGLTQVLAVTTLGAPSLHQLIESAAGEESKRYMHHYSMPPYSMGEVGRFGNPSRREIGHGALAEKALEPVIPGEEVFPYTIRIVSEVLSSNGSTSMASTCGSTLSLMDAGVPILAPVAGLAMGLVTGKDEGENGDFVILTDIAGIEDFNGEMDFKIAGTEKGITAIQLDVKVSGLTDEIIEKTFSQAKEGRFFILGKMLAVLDKPRQKISQYAPKVAILHIDQDKIGEVIGPGGRVIRKLIEETGTSIEVEDDGSVNISGIDEASVAIAIAKINGLTQDAEVGKTYDGEVKRIQPFGAFVEILPGKEGLVHVSQMAEGFIDDPAKVVSLGQKVKVKVMEIDDRGRLNLTMLLEGQKKQETSSRPTGGFRPQKPGFNQGRFSPFSPRPRYKR